MSKPESDNEFYAPQTGNQQVVFDYLESLLEDPDTLAQDTQAELEAIGALEQHSEPEIDPLAEVAPSEAEESVFEEPAVMPQVGHTDGISEEDSGQVDDADVLDADQLSVDEPVLDLIDEEAELLDMPVDLVEDADEVVNAAVAPEAFSPQPEALEEEMIPQPSPPVETEPVVSQTSVTPIAESTPAEDIPKPALHVSDDVLNCILFQLQGLTLAIPVDEVEGAVAMERLTLHLDLEHDWVLGFFSAMGKETSVVDTGSWMLQGRFDPALANYEEVLILKGRRWALACDTLVKSMRMQRSDIVWAGENKSRPWLLGTNMTERCAILDVDKLQMLLDQQA